MLSTTKTTLAMLGVLTSLALARQGQASPFSLASDEFPIVMMGAAPAAHSSLAAMGIDYVHNYGLGSSIDPSALASDQVYFDAAAAQGLRVMVNLRGKGWVVKPNGVEQLRQYVQYFESHSALGYWYLFDEPDNHGVPVEDLLPFYDMIHQETLDVPVAMAHARSEGWWNYHDAQDILMNDSYPVRSCTPFPEAPIENTTVFTEKALAQGQPVIPILQCFNWQVIEAESGARYPTREELRYWAYGSIAMGVRGLAWYSHARSVQLDGGAWFDTIFAPVIHEVRQFVDAAAPAHAPDRIESAAQQGVVLSLWNRGETTWVMVVNLQRVEQTLTLSMDGRIDEAELEPWGESRDVIAAIHDGSLPSLTIEPFEVLLWSHGQSDPRDPCTTLGGTCCEAGESCEQGLFESSSDCEDLCCVGGTCVAPDADAGSTDAGLVDGGEPDPSGEPAGDPTAPAGCACRTNGGPERPGRHGALVVALAALLGLRRRRGGPWG